MNETKEVMTNTWWSTKCTLISKYILSYWFYIHIILLISLAIIQLRFSTVYKDHCTIDNRIIPYLLVIGIIQIIYSSNGILLVIFSYLYYKYRCITFCLVIYFVSQQILLICLVVCFIIGSYLVFHIKDEVQFTNSYSTRTYCNYTLYQTAFWTIIVYYILIIFFSIAFVLSKMKWLMKRLKSYCSENENKDTCEA